MSASVAKKPPWAEFLFLQLCLRTRSPITESGNPLFEIQSNKSIEQWARFPTRPEPAPNFRAITQELIFRNAL